MHKPYAEAAEQNKDAILEVLRIELVESLRVLEIGSGTGQHAVYFASQMPYLQWQPTELAHNMEGLNLWINESCAKNISRPVELDVSHWPWSVESVDVCFTCNTFHIVSPDEVQAIFEGCAKLLGEIGKLIVYGPFSEGGKHTSESNKRFDRMLRASGIDFGVRDLDDLDKWANNAGFEMARLVDMPVNNRMAIWERA